MYILEICWATGPVRFSDERFLPRQDSPNSSYNTIGRRCDLIVEKASSLHRLRLLCNGSNACLSTDDYTRPYFPFGSYASTSTFDLWCSSSANLRKIFYFSGVICAPSLTTDDGKSFCLCWMHIDFHEPRVRYPPTLIALVVLPQYNVVNRWLIQSAPLDFLSSHRDR